MNFTAKGGSLSGSLSDREHQPPPSAVSKKIFKLPKIDSEEQSVITKSQIDLNFGETARKIQQAGDISLEEAKKQQDMKFQQMLFIDQSKKLS